MFAAWIPRPLTRSMYLIVPLLANYQEAKAGCVAYGGLLVSISSQAENDFIVDHVNAE